MAFEKFACVVVTASIAVGSLGLLGCSGADPSPSEAVVGPKDFVLEHGTASTESPFSETVVHLQSDGTKRVEIFYRNASEVEASSAANRASLAKSGSLKAESAAVGTQSFGPLSQCFGADLFFWDQNDFAGNHICIFAPDTGFNTHYVHLTDFKRTSAGDSWAGSATGGIHSYSVTAFKYERTAFYYGWVDPRTAVGLGGEPVLLPGRPDFDTDCGILTNRGDSVANAGVCVNLSQSLNINE